MNLLYSNGIRMHTIEKPIHEYNKHVHDVSCRPWYNRTSDAATIYIKFGAWLHQDWEMLVNDDEENVRHSNAELSRVYAAHLANA